MVDSKIITKATELLQALIGQPLCYGLKSSDMNFYDFGFGELIEETDSYGVKRKTSNYILHVTCRFKVIWKTGTCHTDKYYEDTPSEKFDSDFKDLIGLCVKRVVLSEKNDLWLDFEDCWVVFATFEDGEESWRLFFSDMSKPHIVATDLKIDLV